MLILYLRIAIIQVISYYKIYTSPASSLLFFIYYAIAKLKGLETWPTEALMFDKTNPLFKKMVHLNQNLQYIYSTNMFKLHSIAYVV